MLGSKLECPAEGRSKAHWWESPGRDFTACRRRHGRDPGLDPGWRRASASECSLPVPAGQPLGQGPPGLAQGRRPPPSPAAATGKTAPPPTRPRQAPRPARGGGGMRTGTNLSRSAGAAVATGRMAANGGRGSVHSVAVSADVPLPLRLTRTRLRRWCVVGTSAAGASSALAPGCHLACVVCTSTTRPR